MQDVTDKALLSRLASYYDRTMRADWVFFTEFRLGTGYKTGRRGQACSSEQRIDAFAMCLYPSKGFERHAFEVKVSRGDFNRELRDPLKRLPAYRLCNRFYFVTPPGLVKRAEVPVDAGLVEVNPAPGGKVRVMVKAPFHESDAPHWPFVASLARRVSRGGL